jgi:ParB family transcriptional regulator, chromosome partitioning protein
MTNVTTTIPYGKLILSDINVRKRIPERLIAASIAEHGLIHPLIVSPATPRKTNRPFDCEDGFMTG